MGLMALSSILVSLIAIVLIEVVTIIILHIGLGVALWIAILIGFDICYKLVLLCYVAGDE